MSRLAKKPIQVPDKVTVTLKEGDKILEVKGPLGTTATTIPQGIKISIASSGTNKEIKVERALANDDTAQIRALHGLAAALVKNALKGVTVGFSKELEIHGVGFKAAIEGNKLVMNLGFTHQVKVDIPSDIKVSVDPKQTLITVQGIDKYRVGQFAADVRKIKPPEPYKGTGIRYKGEHIIKKAGKAAGAAAGAAGAGGGK